MKTRIATLTVLVAAGALLLASAPAVAQTNAGPLDAPIPLTIVCTVEACDGAAVPDELGGFAMTPIPFPDAPACTLDPQPIATPPECGGEVSITPTDAGMRCIGAGWATWCGPYTGDVYYTGGPLSQTITLPPGVNAFQFRVEPNPFEIHTIDISVNGGAATCSVDANGDAGAAYVGVHSPDGMTIDSIEVSSATADFAIGEFGISCGDTAFKCLQFDDFCDAIQIDSISGQIINATWHSWDCAGATCPLMGKIGISAATDCGDGTDGMAGIRARAINGCPGDFYWLLDGIDGTMDMHSGMPGGGTCLIDELAYTVIDGPCDTALSGARPGTASHE